MNFAEIDGWSKFTVFAVHTFELFLTNPVWMRTIGWISCWQFSTVAQPETGIRWQSKKPFFNLFCRGSSIESSLLNFFSSTQVEHDTNSLCLVRLTPKKNLFSLCSRNDLPMLQFFVYQCFFKRKGFIIPKLEWVSARMAFPSVFNLTLINEKTGFLSLDNIRNWFPDIGIDLITENFNQTISSQIHVNNEENLLGNLTNKFEVFTECGSLTPLEMCALFQFVRHSPKYKHSSFHEQYNKFCAPKSIKKQSTTSIINSEGQLNGNEYSTNPTHENNS